LIEEICIAYMAPLFEQAGMVQTTVKDYSLTLNVYLIIYRRP